ncbi:MAG TPA: dihydrolipoyl dehydrogenase [Steroidobacteraceae bacterium]|jgi:dihydrolipoamide dehydrogenase|nr:dihydrolipoyl dehydrogenase [Steroidobacteraceae bacterium]
MSAVEVRVPDLGDVKGVTVLDVLVKPGAKVAVEDPLISLESDKAAMDVPSPVSGVIQSIEIKKGAEVTSGTLICMVEADAASPAKADKPAATASATAEPKDTPAGKPEVKAATAAPAGAVDLLVLGAGVGGYTAAFRAADLGLKVTLIERWPMLGGVCLNVGCIPSKALLHAAKVIEDAADMAANGIVFGAPRIDRDLLRTWKNKVVTRLTNGLMLLAKQRKVAVIQGEAKFVGPHSLDVKGEGGTRRVDFKQCIIAAGSESAPLPGLPDDPRVIDSGGALELPVDCKRLLVIGGGIIGLEMACVYDALGVQVSVVELSDGLMPGTDRDLVRPLQKRIEKRYEKILLKTKVAKLEALPEGLRATYDGPDSPQSQMFDRVLVAVGRSANGNAIDAAAAGVKVSSRGLIDVDRQMRTNVAHIFAIGDIVGAPMLAHKASHQGKVAAEVAAGHKASFDARCIPAVAYTDPEIAWAGLTETDAKAGGIQYGKGTFPWAASGRSLALNRDDGFTKLLFDKETHRILGAGIVGTNAGDLIAEVALAIEMGADAADIGLTIHPHPTLSETVAFAAEAFDGTLTDLYIPKR